jgi:hypothetical protein
MPAELGLLKYRNAVSRDLEPPTGTGEELDIDIRKLCCEFGRQPGGPGLVASNGAVFDGDRHGGLMGRCIGFAGNIARTAMGCAKRHALDCSKCSRIPLFRSGQRDRERRVERARPGLP